MYNRVKQTGIFALGVGTLAYMCHGKHHNYTVLAEGNHDKTDEPGTLQDGHAQSTEIIPEELQHLKLQQVQVMFRHGARTPLHLIPKIPEASYDPNIIMREHQASQFPSDKVLCTTGEPIDWSDYELKLAQTPLKNGVPSGALTVLGKDQVYMLGKRLQSFYRNRLGLSVYDPQDVLVLSSNIRRTVESAKCVLAGFYGKEELQEFAKNHTPVKIYVTDKNYNILVPDAYNCAVLKQVNHAGMFHSDFIPGFKSDRLTVEKQISEDRDKKIKVVRDIQNRIDTLHGSSGIGDSFQEPSQESSGHRQMYTTGSTLHSLIQERNQAISRVERLWVHAIARHPNLVNVITSDDMKALIYLRRLEIERLGGKFQPGYRFHFYFDSNPYFSNEHLCKEVYTHNASGAASSWSTPIVWKEYGKVIEEGIVNAETLCQCQVEVEENKKSGHSSKKEQSGGDQRKPCTCDSSFFKWYVQPTDAGRDHIWRTIRDEIWANPLKNLEEKSKHPDKWDRNFNFVFGRDDLVGRVTHGLPYPPELKTLESIIEERATTMLYYAMTGQHEAERSVVARLSAGPLLTAMVEESEKLINGKQSTHKLCLYSSHDSTMCGLLVLLGIWDNKWPPFAADIRLELYKEENGSEYYVRVLYCDQVQRISGQDKELLSWPEFMKVVSKQLIRQEEYSRICASNVLEQMAKDLLKHEEGEILRPQEAPAGM